MKKILLTLAVALTAILGAYADDYDTQYAKDLLQAGTVAPDFTLNAPNGKPLSLKDLKGKYVVVDFWASWCPDCRKDIPKIKQLHEKYGDKVEFLGVSFDDDRNKWINCLGKEGMNWRQVSELKRMRDSQLAKTYGVKWIPSMMVISPDGKVELATVMVEKLEKKLKEIAADIEK